MSYDKKKFNKISDRIKSIDTMLTEKDIEPMFNFNKNKMVDSISTQNEDIRESMGKKYKDFNKVIESLGGKLLYIKSGSTGHTFKGVYPDDKDNTKPNYAVKVVAYPKREKYGDLYNSKRPENAELMMIKLLSFFVTNKQTPHIILPIATFNTSIKTFVNLPKDNIVKNKKFDQFVKRYKRKEYYNNVSVLISEWANSGDLLDYLRKNYQNFSLKHWRVIIFQILSVLSVIQAKYPSFRHNDMKANNILVNNIGKARENNNFQYKINGQIYIVPNIGIQVKLWDFDFACIPDKIDNCKVEAEWTSKINVIPKKNRYYDIHYFFNTLTRKGFFPQFYTAPEIPDKIKKFVKRIIPAKYRTGENVAERGRLLIDDEYLTPDEILKTDKLFKPMRISS